MHIHNIYSPPKSTNNTNALDALVMALREHPGDHHIVLGDFNLHHPLWTGPMYHRQDQEVDELIHILEDFSLQLVSPPGTPTFERGNAQTTIDLVFMTIEMRECTIKCQVRRDLQQDSDHTPIATTLDLSAPVRPPETKPNWRYTDTEKLTQAFLNNIHPEAAPDSIEALENYTNNII